MYSSKRQPIREILIRTWEVSDEYGWREIRLYLQGKDLCLFAYDQDGEEVPHNLF